MSEVLQKNIILLSLVLWVYIGYKQVTGKYININIFFKKNKFKEVIIIIIMLTITTMFWIYKH